MNKALAKKIITKLSSCTDFQSMDLIDETGEILASLSEKRVGKIVRKALELFRTRSETMVIDMENGKSEGYLLISGHEKGEVILRIVGLSGMVSEMIKGLGAAVSLTIEYETEIETGSHTGNSRAEFMSMLFHSEPFNLADIRLYSNQLNIKEELVRVPILIDAGQDGNEVMQLLQEYDGLTSQDLLEIKENKEIFLFKTVECPMNQFMQEYKYVLAESFKSLLHEMRSKNMKYNFYFGPAQNDYSSYRQAMYYCEWMRKNIKKNGSFYFYDYVVKYLESVAPFHELNAIFGVLGMQMGEKMIASYMETMEILIDKDYNLMKSSESLHIHKNTLVYRLDKIREWLNMNPLNYNADREFMEGFYFYLKRLEEKRKGRESYGAMVSKHILMGADEFNRR